MSNSAENTASAASAAEEVELPTNQTLKDPGRTPRLGVVIVYDGDQKTVEVHNEKDPRLAGLAPRDYSKIKLPSRRKQVTIFVDSETESKPTTESATDGQGNVVLAKIYLDHLGKYHQLLRFLGLLTTLIVLNPASWGGSSSQISVDSFNGGEQ